MDEIQETFSPKQKRRTNHKKKGPKQAQKADNINQKISLNPTSKYQKPRKQEKSHKSPDADFDRKPPKKHQKNNPQKTKAKKTFNNTKKLIKTQDNLNKSIYKRETISYTTYIELDMHRKFKGSKKPLDWVPMIRDILFEALRLKVDLVCFIPGQGIHSEVQFSPEVRPIVLLTSYRLGFECFIEKRNKGTLIADISTYHEIKIDQTNTTEEEEDEEEGTTERNDEFGDDDYDFLFRTISLFNRSNKKKNLISPFNDIDCDDKEAFDEVKRRFPFMPKICIDIICTRRNKEQAVRFAESFEQMLQQNLTNITKIDNKKEEELIEEMNLVKQFEERYELDREIISKVVHEKKNKKSITAVLDQISNQIPDSFFIHLTDIIVENDFVPIDVLLKEMKNRDYEIERIQQALNEASYINPYRAAVVTDMMDINVYARKNRFDGLPMFIPSIEINLSNAGFEKAKRHLERIMEGVAKGLFTEIDFVFNEDPNSSFCKPKEIYSYLNQITENKGFKVEQRELKYKKGGKHVFISKKEDDNDVKDVKEKDNEEEEEEEEEDGSFDESLFYKSFRRVPIK